MSKSQIIYHKNPLLSKCPQCGQLDVLRRSHAKNLRERLLKYSFRKVYRCRNCGWRGKLSTITIKRSSIKNLFGYLFLIVIGFYAIYRILLMVVNQ
ncbi:MAG: hypothetical protein STSR0008_05830 [Ignavibacterium sp.]